MALLVLQAGTMASAQDVRSSAALAEGRALLSEHKCNGACHQSYSADNDPLTLYTRADRKARNRAELDMQVRRCVASLGSMMFPEDMQNVSAALDADYYRFGQATGGTRQ